MSSQGKILNRLTDREKHNIKVLYLSGMSQEKVGDVLNIERTVVGYWVRKFGIQRDLSESHIGRPNKSKTKFKKGFTPWNKGKNPEYVQKSNNPAWKDGRSRERRYLRDSLKYKNWRRDVFVRDQFTCQRCGHKYIKIVAHHIKKFSDYPELRFDVNNGQTLCRSCHFKVHENDIINARRKHEFTR